MRRTLVLLVGMLSIAGPSAVAPAEPGQARTLVVEVRDPAGQPLCAEVGAWSRMDGPVRKLGPEITGDDGIVVLEWPSPASSGRSWSLHATATGCAGASARVLEGTERVSLVLQRYGSLRGRVRWIDGSPVACGTTLWVERGTAASPERSHAIVYEGEYELGELVGPVRSVRLAERKARAWGHLECDVTIGSGETVVRDFVFERPASLRATVRDRATGRPIAGARLEHFEEDAFESDEHGVLIVPEMLARDGAKELWFVHDGYAKTSVRIPPVESDFVEVDVALEPGTLVEGILEDARGAPLGEVHVEAFLAFGNASSVPGAPAIRWTSALTDAEGRFRLRALPSEGVLELMFWRFETASARRFGHERIDVAEAAMRRRWTMPDSVPLRGSVVDPSGRPVAFASIEGRLLGEFLRNPVSDAEGTFEIRVAPGRQQVSAAIEASSFARVCLRRRARVEVDVGPAGLDGVRIVLPPAPEAWSPVRVIVIAVDARTRVRLAAPGVRWSGRDTTFQAEAPESKVRCLADGSYEFVAPAGSHDVTVVAEGHAPVTQLVELSADEPIRRIEIALP